MWRDRAGVAAEAAGQWEGGKPEVPRLSALWACPGSLGFDDSSLPLPLPRPTPPPPTKAYFMPKAGMAFVSALGLLAAGEWGT